MTKDMKFLWAWADAVEMALDMYHNGEIAFNDMDRTANELFAEMQAANAE